MMAMLAASAACPLRAHPQLMPEQLWRPFSNASALTADRHERPMDALLGEIADRISPAGLEKRRSPGNRLDIAAPSAGSVVQPPGTIGVGQQGAGEPAGEAEGAPPSVPAQPRPPPRAEAAQGNAPDSGGETTLRDFIRFAVSAVGGPFYGADTIDEREAGFRPANVSVTEEVLNAALSTEVINFITEISTPALSPDGFIALSVANLGRFIMLFSREAGGFRLIDPTGSNHFALGNTSSMSMHFGPDALGNPHIQETASSGNAFTIADLISQIRGFIDSYILNPFTLAAAVLSILIWVVWRLRSGEA